MGEPKPLTRLHDLPIIVRIIHTVKEAGIKHFIIVIGYLGHKIKEELGDGSKYKVEIEYVENPEWQKANGISVLKAKNILNENFILVMGDHIFDKNILARLKDERIENDEVILAVDQAIGDNDLIDIDDVTKVCVENARIIDIGKNIVKYNAFDTGIFLCSPSIFTAIEKSILDNNDDSLTGGIKYLAKKGKARAFNIENSFWIDIDDEKSFQKAEQYLEIQ